MASYAWVLGIKPGYEEEYKRRHDEIWPDMTEALKQSGIRNYHIFKHGLTHDPDLVKGGDQRKYTERSTGDNNTQHNKLLLYGQFPKTWPLHALHILSLKSAVPATASPEPKQRRHPTTAPSTPENHCILLQV